jgi:hypothetical protein
MSNSDLESAIKAAHPSVTKVQILQKLGSYPDSWRSPEDKGTTYKVKARVTASGTFLDSNHQDEEMIFSVFRADKDGKTKANRVE